MPTGAAISFPTSDADLVGWLACPDGEGPHPALVLVPDVHGLSDHYRDVAMRYAAEGVMALAVDLYGREGTPVLADLDAITRWIRSLPDPQVLGDLVAAREWLRARPDVRPDAIGITGHCMGGQYALLAACRDDRWTACVVWYGMLRYAHYDDRNPASPLDCAGGLGCPLLGLFGAADALIPPADVDALEATVRATGHPVEIHRYAGAGHAFFNDRRPDAYRPEASADAWARTLAFLTRHLGKPTPR